MHTYTPEKTVQAERLIALCAKAAGVKPLEGPVSVEVTAMFLVPNSWSKKRKAEANWHTAKPDADNIGKLMDSLNGIAYRDDAQVAELTVRKVYAAMEGIRIKLTQIGGEDA
jgi:Holliday junction resolvase RusA-like endonuclease